MRNRAGDVSRPPTPRIPTSRGVRRVETQERGAAAAGRCVALLESYFLPRSPAASPLIIDRKCLSCFVLVSFGVTCFPTGGGPWPRAPPRAWAPLSPGRKQGCSSHPHLAPSTRVKRVSRVYSVPCVTAAKCADFGEVRPKCAGLGTFRHVSLPRAVLARFGSFSENPRPLRLAGGYRRPHMDPHDIWARMTVRLVN